MGLFLPPSRVTAMVCLVCAVAASSAAAPAVHFEERAVILTDVLPDASIAVVGVGRDHDGLMPRLLTLWDVVTADATGSARLDLELDVPAESTWVAVDLETGEISVAAADGVATREVDFPSHAIPATLRTFDVGRARLAILWVRPASGGTGAAWGGQVSDGGERDADGGENRSLQVALDHLTPLGTSPVPPETLASGDVLVGIDPDTLETYAARLVR